jgi:zinc and cadmium transporter
MSFIALVGTVTFILKESTLHKIILPLVALSAGSLLGGAFFHMIPASLMDMGNTHMVFVWVLLGFTSFMVLEQVLHWHHCHQAYGDCKQPLSYLILIGDGLHNFIGGIAIAGIFLIDIRLGQIAWLAAIAHEIPQELGDYGVLIHGGWGKKKALLFNTLSALTYLLGGILAYLVSFKINLDFLIPFAAGNFIYVGATDLIPEVNKQKHTRGNLINTGMFVLGLCLMWIIKYFFNSL